MDKVFQKIKISFIAIIGTLNSWLGILAVPMLILVLLNIIDYITGLGAAPYRNEKISSNVGFRGIAKKICMWLLVAIGAIVDWLLMFSAQTIGIDFKLTFLFAALVAVWLITNEIISILENMADIGVDLPPFLKKIASKIRDTAESKGDINENIS